MYRFITHLLIIAVLATNIAWAEDNCAESSVGDASILVQVDNSQSDGVCDDFCVGWLHLVSITPEARLGDFAPVRQTVMWTGISYYSRDQEPPLRPPQI
jgi:hypothetical protein